MSDLDVDALRAKYRQERDKRLRSDGNAQYVPLVGNFDDYLTDPYSEPLEREPLRDTVEVLIIGGGFGGLLAGVRLRQAGFDDIRVIEQGGDFGGTWYWNRYPGCACDIESYIYLPMLEEMGYMPTEHYASAPEIMDYGRAIARRFGLYDNACFQTEVQALTWEDGDARWIVETNRGDKIRARFVCSALGFLARPKFPGIPGIETFGGHSFHTARWDYSYTGGDCHGNLTGLKDKVVGIIGTGSTSIQCVPHLGDWSKHLYVFQRTPSAVDERHDRPTDLEWWNSLAPGWHRRRIRNFTALTTGSIPDEPIDAGGWTDINRRIVEMLNRGREAGDVHDPELARQLADFEKMEQIRARVDSIVKDPAVAAALKPYYNQMCKRPGFSDNYLQTFNRPNVTLVDTDGKGVERITERGIVAAGREYPLDCIIYSTGFDEAGSAYTDENGLKISGRGGRLLSEHWSEGARTLHGMHCHGFPNLFIVSLLQSARSPNFAHALDEEARHIAYILQEARRRGADVVEASAAAEAEWVAIIEQKHRLQRAFLEECTPSILNAEGKLDDINARNSSYGGGPLEFFDVLESWRAAGDLEGMELRSAADLAGGAWGARQ